MASQTSVMIHKWTEYEFGVGVCKILSKAVSASIICPNDSNICLQLDPSAPRCCMDAMYVLR